MVPYRAKRLRNDLDFGATDTEKSMDSAIEGELHQMALRVPNFTNVITAALILEDEDGFELFNSGPKAKGADYLLSTVPDELVLAGKITTKVKLSGAPGGEGGTVPAVLFYIGI